MKNFVILFSLFSLGFSFIEEENDDLGGLLYDGDIYLNSQQRNSIKNGGDIFSNGKDGYTAMRNVSILWLPNNKTVPYIISPELENIAAGTFGLMQGLREWEERSCITFKERTNEKDYINFFKNYGCWSYVGRQGGRQNISLDEGCWGIGTVTHEIGHAMGFGHEQNRPDRDEYITIRWENIVKSEWYNFYRYTSKQVDSMNSPYDYKSFMQYSKTAFGINDSITLDPGNRTFQLGQRLGFTEEDQYQAMHLYRCNGKTTRQPEKPKTYAVQGNDTCDFENGLCHYYQDNNDDFDWIRRYGGTSSDGTGPETDHTTGRMGVFVYIEASSPRKEGDTARLHSKVFLATKKTQCLTFFYHMFSYNKTMMGTFNVYLNDSRGSRQILMSQDGSSMENNWMEKRLTFQPIGNYQIILEGIRGSGYQGDIAIDDISFNEGSSKRKLIHHKAGDFAEIGQCEDIADRESQYCGQWKKADFCNLHKKEMKKFCRKTCNFC